MSLTRNLYQQILSDLQTKDPIMHKLLLRLGYIEPPPARNLFATLIQSIIGQKVRYAVARQQRAKLYVELGTDNFSLDDVLNRCLLELQEQNRELTTMEDILDHGLLFFKTIGITDSRFGTIRNVLDHCLSNHIDEIQWESLDQFAHIRGIGPWTMTCTKLMYTMGHHQHDLEDQILWNDLIIRRGIKDLYGIDKPRDIITLASQWSPWRGIVTWYLWKAYS